MTKLPDYSDFLDQEGMLEYIESEWQKNSHIHKAQAELINKIVRDNKINSLIEVGSSTGNLSRLLDVSDYTGIDKNVKSVLRALEKNKDKRFYNLDIRVCKGIEHRADLICAFAIMKHFGLHEWKDIFEILVSLSSNIVVIDVPISDKTFDDGEQYGHHHVWFSLEELKEIFKDLDLKIVQVDYSNPVEPVFVLKK